ncbi:hypothetical protein BDD12DRAFT_800570 [Trichophaea hybrida]|nr:hypothetical protein BDD12DRAFT_800570 [Trichophaea hybrida]
MPERPTYVQIAGGGARMHWRISTISTRLLSVQPTATTFPSQAKANINSFQITAIQIISHYKKILASGKSRQSLSDTVSGNTQTSIISLFKQANIADYEQPLHT